MGLSMIGEYLASLPENPTHHQYLMWYRVENDDNEAWARQEEGALRPDDIEYPRVSPFVSLRGIIP